MKIWAMKNQVTGGEKEILNGKLFYITKDEKGSAVFIDIDTQKAIWVTSSVLDVIDEDSCRILKTYNGSMYEIVDVVSLLPTKAAVTEQVTEPITSTEVDPIIILDKNITSRDINYCNGYVKTEFTFNRDITEAEFITVLMENSYRLHETEGWWDDHSEISGSKTKWMHTWVRAYTD